MLYLPRCHPHNIKVLTQGGYIIPYFSHPCITFALFRGFGGCNPASFRTNDARRYAPLYDYFANRVDMFDSDEFLIQAAVEIRQAIGIEPQLI